MSAGQQQLLSTAALTGNSALFDLGALSAGTHQVIASYSGDSSHAPAETPLVAVTIAPLPVTASMVGPALVYGQPLPSFTGTLSGVLPRDAANVQAGFSLANASFPLSPGSYPVGVTLAGSAASNYQLVPGVATVTITPAPATVSLSHDAGGFSIGVVSSTIGRPTGAVALMTSAGSELASLPVSATGQTALSDAGLTAGTYAVTAIYSGDTNFLSSHSAMTSVTIGGASAPPAASDFSIAPAGASAQSASPGGSASFVFALKAAGQALAGPILLAVSGAPPNSSATFTPSLVSPGTTAASLTLNVILPRSSATLLRGGDLHGAALAALLPCLLLPWRGWRRQGSLLCAILFLPLLLVGCGDRILSTATTTSSAQNYTLLVTGTTTMADGSSLQHSTSVTLTVP